jgi:uncharacterized protein (TIGR00730 family)
MKKPRRVRPFRSAKEELKLKSVDVLSEQTNSPSYQLAFLDQDFLLRESLRPIRLQLELLKPELLQRDANIHSTVVIFGSARIPEPKVARRRLNQARAAAKRKPTSIQALQQVKLAERILAKSHYYEEARKLANLISLSCQNSEQREFVVVTGGGPGIMEAANRGAHEVAAKSIGLNIVLPAEQGPNPYISPELCFQFHYFAIRKMHFLIRARAIVAFPGGFGTLDELFEVLTLIQTGKIKPIPVILFGQSYWSRIINFDALVEEGTIDANDAKLFQYVETAQQAWEVIANFYQDVIAKECLPPLAAN